MSATRRSRPRSGWLSAAERDDLASLVRADVDDAPACAADHNEIAGAVRRVVLQTREVEKSASRDGRSRAECATRVLRAAGNQRVTAGERTWLRTAQQRCQRIEPGRGASRHAHSSSRCGAEAGLVDLSQARDRRAEVRGGVVPELRDARMAFERRLHDAALHAAAAAVDQPHLAQARVQRRRRRTRRTTDGMSRGANAWRSSSRSIGMRTGSSAIRSAKAVAHRGSAGRRVGHARSADPQPLPSHAWVARGDDRLDAAAHREVADDGHAARLQSATRSSRIWLVTCS